MVFDAQHPLYTLDLAFTDDETAVAPQAPACDGVGPAADCRLPAGLLARLRRWAFSPSHTEYVDLLGSSHQHRSCCG